MKKKFSIIALLTIITIFLTGCSKYEKDKSYDTDLYGSYLKNIEAFTSNDVNDINENTKYSYYLYEKYKLNAENTFQYTVKEIIEDNITKDNFVDGEILSIEEISGDITQITLGQEITEWSTGEISNQIIYKYKNMLGDFYKIEVPSGKTFKLQLNDYAWYDEKGQYHMLCDGNKCECPKYIRKDNIIYFFNITYYGKYFV